MSALETQVAGTHYKDLAIQPVEYIHANGIGFCEGAAIKYLTRWKSKGGLEDLRKARHFVDLLIELEVKSDHAEKTRARRERMKDYCDSEQYDMTGDMWSDATAVDFGPCENQEKRYDVFAVKGNCEHPSWHNYVSTKTRVCTDCGYEQPLSDNARQVEHSRKSNC